jgi:hypothetical protein
MKRSEAIEEIRKILAMNGKDNGYGELEEAILHQLESVGMLPPKACIERSVRVGDEERTAYHNTHEWESEDDLP